MAPASTLTPALGRASRAGAAVAEGAGVAVAGELVAALVGRGDAPGWPGKPVQP
jgi:hypothetical protein